VLKITYLNGQHSVFFWCLITELETPEELSEMTKNICINKQVWMVYSNSKSKSNTTQFRCVILKLLSLLSRQWSSYSLYIHICTL